MTAPLRSRTSPGDRFTLAHGAGGDDGRDDAFVSNTFHGASSLGTGSAGTFKSWASGSYRRVVLDRPATTSSLTKLSGGRFENPTVDSIYDSAHHAYRTFKETRMDGRAAFDLCLKERLVFIGEHAMPERQPFDVATSADRARIASVAHLPEPEDHDLPEPAGKRASTASLTTAPGRRSHVGARPEAPPPPDPLSLERAAGLVEADAPIYRKPLTTVKKLHPCPNGCRALLELRHKPRHLERECPKRMVRCRSCNAVVHAEDLTDHATKTCPGWARTWRQQALMKRLKAQSMIVANAMALTHVADPHRRPSAGDLLPPAAPAPAPDAPGQGICICSCQHHFVPDEPQEMGLDVGDFVLVLKAELHTSEGWIFAEHVSGRSSGYVPVAYLQFVREWNDLSGAKSGDA